MVSSSKLEILIPNPDYHLLLTSYLLPLTTNPVLKVPLLTPANSTQQQHFSSGLELLSHPEPADVILFTHDHPDHCETASIAKLLDRTRAPLYGPSGVYRVAIEGGIDRRRVKRIDAAERLQVGPFERLIELPVKVDHADVSAHYDKGILNIRLLKLKEQKRERRVEIE